MTPLLCETLDATSTWAWLIPTNKNTDKIFERNFKNECFIANGILLIFFLQRLFQTKHFTYHCQHVVRFFYKLTVYKFNETDKLLTNFKCPYLYIIIWSETVDDFSLKSAWHLGREMSSKKTVSITIISYRKIHIEMHEFYLQQDLQFD